MAKYDLKVRITLNGTAVEGNIDELLENGMLKIEYDQAEFDKIVEEEVARQRAEYEKSPHCGEIRPLDGGSTLLKLPGEYAREEWLYWLGEHWARTVFAPQSFKIGDNLYCQPTLVGNTLVWELVLLPYLLNYAENKHHHSEGHVHTFNGAHTHTLWMEEMPNHSHTTSPCAAGAHTHSVTLCTANKEIEKEAESHVKNNS